MTGSEDRQRRLRVRLGIRVRYFQFQTPNNLNRVFDEMAREHDQALLIWTNPHLNGYRRRIFDLAMQYRLPAIYDAFSRGHAGEFMVYAPNNDDVVREAALYVDKIFKGANPGDLPIGQPTRMRLVINLKTAKALGLKVPPSFVLRADEVIE